MIPFDWFNMVRRKHTANGSRSASEQFGEEVTTG